MKTIYSFTFLLLGIITVNAQTARIQVIHNSADLSVQQVDVYVNDVLLLDNMQFRTASSFIDAPAGIPLSIDVAPASSTSSAASIFNTAMTLTSGATYIVVADGIISTSGYNPDNTAAPFDLKIYNQGQESAGSSSNTDVLVHHGSTDAPAIDIVETSVPAGTVVSNASYGDFTGYLNFITANYIIEVRSTGSTTAIASYQAPLSTLGLSGQAVTLVASGFLDPTQNSSGPAFGLWAATTAGGALLELQSATASIDDLDKDSFLMYPNPCEDLINIELLDNTFSVNASIFNIQGKMVKSLELTSMNTIDLRELKAGIYIVKIGNVSTKLIKS